MHCDLLSTDERTSDSRQDNRSHGFRGAATLGQVRPSNDHGMIQRLHFHVACEH